MKKLAMLLLLPLLLLSGCGLFWDDPYVTVTNNALNWVEIHYFNANREPVRRVALRITGSGFVEVKSGTSRRVSDSFAKGFSEDTWNDFRSSRYHVDPDHVREVFQDFVNAGLFDKDKIFRATKYPSTGRMIAVRAALDNKTITEVKNLFEEDPELAERLYNAVLEFNKPHLGKKSQSKKNAEGKKDSSVKNDEKASEKKD
jgi:hypothetical protein